ncbi:unnamed protein product [Lampetra fluviatilis]
MAERRDAALGPSERRRRARPPRPDTRGQRGQQQHHSRDAERDVNQNARPSSSGPLSSLRAALKRSTSNRAPSPAERRPHPPHRNSDTPDLSDFQTYYSREDYEGFYAPFELPPSYEEAVFGVLPSPDLQQGAQALQYEAISESRPRQRQALQPNQASRQIQADLPEQHSPRREQARRPERAPRPSEAHVEEQQTSGRTHDSAVPRSGLVSIATQTASEDISEQERELRRSSTATASAPPRPPPPRLTIDPVVVTPLLPPPPAATSPRSPDHCLLDLPLEAEDHLGVLPATTVASQAPVASSLELLSARPTIPGSCLPSPLPSSQGGLTTSSSSLPPIIGIITDVVASIANSNNELGRFGNGESRVGDAAPLKPKPNVRPKSCVLVLPPGDGTSINGGGAKGCREDDARRPSAPPSSVADAVSSFSAMASTNSCGRPLMPQGPKPMALLPSKPLPPPKPGAKQAGSAVPAMQGGGAADLYAVVNKRPAGTAAAAAAITQGGGAADLYAVVNKRPAGTAAAAAAITQGGGAADLYAVVNKRSVGAAVAAAASMERPQVDPASWSDEEQDDSASGGTKHDYASLRKTLEGYSTSETLPLRKPTIIRPTASDVAKVPRKPSQFQASTRYGSSRSLDELGDNNRASESRANFTDDLSQCLKRPSTQKVPPKKPPPPRPNYLPGNTRGPARTDAAPRGRSRERRGNDVNNDNSEDQQGDLPPRPGPGHPLYNTYMLPMPHVLTRVENQAKAPNELSFKPYEVLPLVAEQDGVWLECRRGDRVGRVRRSLVNIVTPLDDGDGGDDGRGSAPGNSPCAEVLFDFTAEGPGELSLAVGDTVRMLGREPGGEWLRGELRGKTGIFPACYVRVLVDVEDNDEISSGPRCLVRFAFEPGQEDELALEEGAVVALCARDPGGEWARGRLRDGREGLFPLDFVEILEDLPLGAGEEKPRVQALYDFVGQDVKELSFKTGDVLTILGAEDLEWLKGELNGKVGIFPKNYVTEI